MPEIGQPYFPIVPAISFPDLLPPEDHWGGTGLLPPPPNWHQGFPLTSNVPRIRAQMEIGLPQTADLAGFVEGIYDQGQTPRCASYSASALLSLVKRAQHGPGSWWRFDADRLFTEGGGTDAGGMIQSMDTVLDDAGGIRVDTQQRYKESGWTVVPSVPGIFEQTIQAAIAVGKPVHLALLLPTGFGRTRTGTPTSAYHAVVIVGYDATGFKIVNSWGPNFGQNGFAWIDAAYLTQQGFLGGYNFALVVTDASDGGPAPNPLPNPTPTPTPTDDAAQILALLNQARTAAGLKALTLDSRLTASAQGFAQTLSTWSGFDHTGPDGSTPFSRMHAAGYPNPGGENIARSFSTPAEAFAAWMASPGHHANMIYPGWTTVGIGVQQGSQGKAWVQDFGLPAGPDPNPNPNPGPNPNPIPPVPPVPPAGDPAIAEWTPDPVARGGTFTISGANFGANGIVGFSFDQPAIIQSWSNTQIVCIVPQSAVLGVETFVVQRRPDNKLAFNRVQVIQTGPVPPPPPPPPNLIIQVAATSSVIRAIPSQPLPSGTSVDVALLLPDGTRAHGSAIV